ncbi:hypothetical protein H4Q26_012524 [Puccinia striiformis f. sp. tritici PST-130]|nr:hypothetical protein H4Q26_012524 [Puccinia striiformis f. sp. tritici PST-130]
MYGGYGIKSDGQLEAAVTPRTTPADFTAKPQPDSPSASAEAKADNKNEGSPPITAITMPSITQAIKNELNITISPKSNPASLPPNIPASVEPIMTTQENNKPPTITTEDTSKYMAIHLVDQIRTANPPRRSSSIHSQLPSPLFHPRISDFDYQINPEILYTADPVPHVLPITLFPSAMIFSPGNKVAVDGFISYATKRVGSEFEEDNVGYEILSEINSVDSHSLIGPEKLLTDRSKNTRFLQIQNSSQRSHKGGGLLTTQYQSLQPPSQEDDSTYIERVAANRQSTSSSTMHRSRSNSWVAARTMFVDRISEIPSPDPISHVRVEQEIDRAEILTFSPDDHRPKHVTTTKTSEELSRR